MKTYPFDQSTFRMESTPIHTKTLQFVTINGHDLGTKYHVA